MAHNGTNNQLTIEKNIFHILDLLSDGIYISDREGLTLAINTMYEKITGLKKENLVGRNVEILTKDGIFDTILNPIVVRTGKPASSVQTDRKGNKLVLNGYPIFDDSGQVALVVTFARDVTLMAQLKEQIASQRELIEKYRSNVQYINEESVQRHPLIAHSREMTELNSFIGKVAETDATVLLQGETGVGKDVLARQIHRLSQRNGRPFFKVDCPTIPENLIESELFGYVPGAFSGANTKGKLGFFEMADKGTIFLDEIGELPLSMQTKLLRVLQDQEILRIGSTKVQKVDVRIIAATNRDLEDEVRQGRFRSDLYYRLHVAVVTIPPLRDRREDILPLAEHFLQRYTARYKKTIGFGPGVADVFLGYRWPGNVRELENFIQSLVVTNEDGDILVSDLPSNMVGHLSQKCREVALSAAGRGPEAVPVGPGVPGASLYEALDAEGMSLKEIMADIEREILQGALKVHGSISKVAEVFKIDRSTIFRKLKKDN